MANSRTPSPETTRPSSPLSWPPSHEGSPTNDSNKLTTSPLYLSLLASVSSAGAVTKEAVGEKNIPMENNPRPLLTQMGDKAEYWVNGSGDLLCLKFPARLDFHGHYSHLGPYFNLPDSGLDLASLKRARGHFELHFLSPDDEESAQYPQEALDMSCRVLETLSALTTEVEDVRNAYNFVLLVKSEPLFKDLLNDNQGAVPRISRSDIGKSKELLSPSKAKILAQRKEQQAASRNEGCSAASVLKAIYSDVTRIGDLYDPDSRYSGLGTLRKTKVECPDVRDGQGALIHPCDYRTKLQQARFVEVEIYLKLWSIPAKTKVNYMMSDRDKFGSRNYQIVMRRMQLLPCTVYLKPTVLDPKGKRKASEEAVGQLAQKKSNMVIDDMDINF
ncbi:hypothetical protein BD769DRAFT_1381529 [Suillus cothurnatus]|nr:hypothetical protein BD769DRAFT_1381529 [Suillus cothurnatus]